MTSSGEMSIGAAATRFGVATHVLRHWESVGLLTPGRNATDRRLYSDDDLFRIGVVLRSKQAGLPLETIRDLLSSDDPAHRRELLAGHRAALADRIARDQAALALLECAAQCAHPDLAGCPHFREQARPHLDGVHGAATDLPRRA
jgi:MerR family transcriptional regulator, copper efflux regulator